MAEKTRFAGYPSAVAYEAPDGKTAAQHLLWGDFIRDKGEKDGSYSGVKDVHGERHDGRYVRARIRGREEDCWVREHEIQDERCLEVIFVDIGQGDGCMMITPNDKHMVIDAGEGDNMYRFLRWRFGKFKRKFTFEAGIVTHPDSDHYKGFDALFDDDKVFFETLYHNGIVERFGKDTLGPKGPPGRGRKFLTGLIRSKAELEKLLADTSNWQKPRSGGGTSFKQYPTMLHKGLTRGKFGKFEMLSVQDGHLPGYGPEKELSIQVLGPVPEPVDSNPPRLRWIENKGKTKNGHSVVLRAQYRDVSILLGGDLNIPSENLLLSHHTGLESPPKSAADERALIEAAKKVFRVDVAKSCHHGSSDFSSVYLQATDPIATVISSGDNEPHSHPRADALGTIGRYSRGDRPLVFSTELARSAPEMIKHPNVLRRQFERELQALADAPATTAAEKKAKKKLQAALLDEANRVLNRSVAVYGAINVVTDGHKVVIAQKLERARGKSKKWDIYRLESEGLGPLRYQSKH